MCVFDLSEVGEGKVRYGDGCLWYKGVFGTSRATVCLTRQSGFYSRVSSRSVSPFRLRSDTGESQVIR